MPSLMRSDNLSNKLLLLLRSSRLGCLAHAMNARTLLLLSVLIGGLLTTSATARTWTSNDGKEIEAEYVSATETEVTIKREEDSQSFTIPLERLSEADRKWVAEELAKPVPITGEFAELITGDWELAEYEGLPYAIYGKNLDGRQKYPLLLSLHGKSSNNENGKQLGFTQKFTDPRHYKERPCIIVAPLCYQPYGETGGGWSDKPGDQAIALVKALKEGLPVDEKRIYTIGFSMGGFGVCYVMSQEPKLFTAGVPVAGYGWGSMGKELEDEPIWLFQAADDPVVKASGARAFAESLKRSKVFHYTEYPEGGHGIISRVLADEEMFIWLFSQVDD